MLRPSVAFVDHENLIKRWEGIRGDRRLDWLALPSVLQAAAQKTATEKRRSWFAPDDVLRVTQTRVYTSSFEPNDDDISEIAITTGIDGERLRSIRDSHRRTQGTLTDRLRGEEWALVRGQVLFDTDSRSIRCHRCERPVQSCPGCGAEAIYALKEKGVDMELGCDMLNHAWSNLLGQLMTPKPPPSNVVILVSADADLVPAVRAVNQKGIVVINATWRERSKRLRTSCQATVFLDEYINELVFEVGTTAGVMPTPQPA